ncbi:dihydrofolate reductase [Mariniluteicoccus flavus]
MTERAQRVEVTAIAAVARNGVIGRDNDMVWHIPEDWKRLKAMTMGGVLVMGRRTFAGLGRPLPGRENFVVTRDPAYAADGIRVFDDVDSAIDAALATGKRVWIFGGGQVYAAALPRTTRLEITEVDQEPEGDAHFPEIDPDQWAEVAREPHEGFAYVTLVRR